MTIENAERRRSVRELVLDLLDQGYTPITLSEAMDNRVASRTIYRWARGESQPQNETDYEVLVSLAATAKS